MTLDELPQEGTAGMTRRHALSSAASVIACAAFGRADAGRNLTAPGRGEPPILTAVRAGDRPAVRRLLAANPEVAAARDAAGRSALVLAHLAGHRAIATDLRRALPALDVVEATLERDWGRATALLRAQPELAWTAHPIGGTPLYAAALGDCGQLYRLRELGCAPDAAPKGGSGFTPARGALEAVSEAAARRGLTELLGNGSDVNAPQRGGDSVLHAAVRRRSLVLVRLALRKGADPDARDGRGRTPRDVATELDWAEGAALLAAPASVPRDHRGSRFAFDANRQPLVIPDISDIDQATQNDVTGASHFERERVVAHLKADRRRVFSISVNAELAIEACAHTGNHDIIKLHLDHGAPLSLPTAVSLGDLEFVRFLLDRDPSLVHERGAHDFPVMWYAALGTGSVEMAALLHERGADVDQESMGNTALHWCVMRDRPDLARWLLEHGAEPEAVGYSQGRAGCTPLQLAREKGQDALAAVLKAGGAKV